MQVPEKKFGILIFGTKHGVNILCGIANEIAEVQTLRFSIVRIRTGGKTGTLSCPKNILSPEHTKHKKSKLLLSM